MRLFLVIYFFCFGCVYTAAAQTSGDISGHLLDTVGHQVLQGATITLLNGRDTAETGLTTLSDGHASFSLSRCPLGNYLVSFRFEGYNTAYANVRLSTGHTHADLGEIYLSIRIDHLDSIKIAPPPLLVLKNDTLEYNAGAVKMRDYATLEDLLRKLPGIQIAPDGTLLVNGEPLDQLWVDGRPFFGGDPAIALRNLPAEIIDRIQSYRAGSDREMATGFSQGSGKRTLNIVLKKDRAKGDFGRLGVGGGAPDVYAGGFSLNRFSGPSQLSAFGSLENVGHENNPGFPSSLSTPQASNSLNQAGITRAGSAGVNYADAWSKNTMGYGNILYNNQHTRNNQATITQNLFPGDSSTTGYQNGSSVNTGNGEHIAFSLTEKMDPANTLIFRPDFNTQKSFSNSSTETILIDNRSADTLYKSTGRLSSNNDNNNISSDISFTHLFPKKGTVLFVDLKLVEHNNNNNTLSNNQTDYLNPTAYISGLNQLFTQSVKGGSVNPSVSFSLPLDKHQALELNYSYTWTPNRSSNRALGYNKENNVFDQVDSALSNNFRYTVETHLATASYKLQRDKWQWVAGIGGRSDGLSEQNLSLDSALDRHYWSIVPSSSLQYNFTKNNSLSMNYAGSSSPPTVQQLQPVNTTTDSLSIQKGNASLKQPYSHTLFLSYRAADPRSMRIFSVNLNGSLTVNNIVSSVTQLGNGALVYMPVNVNGAFTASVNTSYGVPVKQWKSVITLSGRWTYNQTPGLLNGALNNTKSNLMSVTLSSSTALADKLDILASSTFGYSAFDYSFASNQNSSYLNVQAAANVNYYLKRWTFSTKALYTFNNSLPPGFTKNVLLLSPSLSLKVLRHGAGEIRFFVFDLLDQNKGINRTVSANVVQDSRSEVLGRYGMLSFSYNIRYFPGHPSR